MASTLNPVLATLPVKRRAKVERRAGELATLKDLRLAVEHTQEDLAVSWALGRTLFRASSGAATCSSRHSAAT
jgi:hypothetical protein